MDDFKGQDGFCHFVATEKTQGGPEKQKKLTDEK